MCTNNQNCSQGCNCVNGNCVPISTGPGLYAFLEEKEPTIYDNPDLLSRFLKLLIDKKIAVDSIQNIVNLPIKLIEDIIARYEKE